MGLVPSRVSYRPKGSTGYSFIVSLLTLSSESLEFVFHSLGLSLLSDKVFNNSNTPLYLLLPCYTIGAVIFNSLKGHTLALDKCSHPHSTTYLGLGQLTFTALSSLFAKL